MQRGPRIKKKKKKSVGFGDETVLYGLVSDAVKYKDGKETEKEKLESAANVLWHRLGGDGSCFPADWNALPERSARGVAFTWKVRG